MRTPGFSSTRNARKRLILSTEPSDSFHESLLSSSSSDAERKYQERINENEQQRNQRLARDRLQKETARSKESDQQRNEHLAQDRLQKEVAQAKENDEQRFERLDNQRNRSTVNRSNQNQLRRSFRLANAMQRSKTSRESETEEQKFSRVRSMSLRRRQKLTTKNQQTHSDRFQWPSAIPSQLKERCLQDFINKMSMTTLKQSTCNVCNARVFANSMTEHTLENIHNRMRLVYHSDLVDPINETQDVVEKNGL